MVFSVSGLRLTPPDWKRAVIAGGLCVAGVTAFVLVLDCLVFRRDLPQAYVALYTSPLMPRTLVVAVMSMVEELKFRLVAMTALALLAGWLLRRQPPAVVMVAVIVAAQWINVGAAVLANPAYASLRYLAVGSVWGWLYWRHGWLAALLGHASAHVLLDPLLAAGLTLSA
jgi:hypothetical protein